MAAARRYLSLRRCLRLHDVLRCALLLRRSVHVVWAIALFCAAATCEAQAQAAQPVRVADAVCGRCHAEILRSYLKTPMANASGLATDRLLPGSYTQPISGIQYSVSRSGDQASLQYSIPGPAPVKGAERLRYFLGSGHLGLTYLYEKNDYWFESPIAYYDALQGYALKPGLENSHGPTPALTLHPACLRCHMSDVQRQADGSDNLYPKGPFLHVGITCESCHGDTREHVASGGHTHVVNPAKLTPERRDSVCIVCHLEGDTSVEHRDRNVLDFKPGEDVSDYRSYYIYAGENTTHRAVSEIEQFSSSRCKLVSGPKMSCTTCHNPHLSPAPAERASFYRSKCLSCHVASQLSGPVHRAADLDCTGCHMPKTGAQNVPHVAWTDHRIRRQPEPAQISLAELGHEAAGVPELLPILESSSGNSGSGPRDRGLAYADLAIAGAPGSRDKAWQLLTSAEKQGQADMPVLRDLGVLAEMKGDHARAAAYYRAALKLDPENLISRMNLGTLVARSGDLEAAAALWQQSFAINRDVPSLGQNLAIVECGLGDRARAQEILAEVLAYNPALVPLRDLLASIGDGQRPCSKNP